MQQIAVELDKILKDAARLEEDFPGQRLEYVRQKAIELSINVGDSIIMEVSKGSVEETDFLTSAVALGWLHKVHIANTSRLLRHQMMEQVEATRKP